MASRFISLLLLAFWTLGSAHSAELAIDRTIYDIDFGAPEHTVGSTPARGTGPQFISMIYFGTPTVRAASGVLLDQPLEFDAVTSYEQIQLNLDLDALGYRIEFDVATKNLEDTFYSFSLTMDTPEVRTFSLHPMYNRFQVWPQYLGESQTLNFQDDVKYRITILVKFVDVPTWEVWVDDDLLYRGPFHATLVESLRFNLSPSHVGAGNAPLTKVALDNIKVYTLAYPATPSVPATIKVKSKPRNTRDSTVRIRGVAAGDSIAYILVKQKGRSKKAQGKNRWWADISLRKGRNVLYVQPVNEDGIKGKAERIVINRVD